MAEVESGSVSATEETQNGQVESTTALSTGENNSSGHDPYAGSETEETAHIQTQPVVGIDKETGQGDSTVSAAVPVDYKAAAANGYRIYMVNAGETLYGICWSNYGNLNHLEEICKLNNLTDVDRILAGQKLILP